MIVRLAFIALMLLTVPAWAVTSLDLANPSPLSDIVVTGENLDAQPRSVTIRVDDHPGAAYADRVNEERIMPSGPFTLRLRLGLLRTPRQRPLDLAAAFRAMVFAPAGSHVVFGPLRLDKPLPLPYGVRGWFFGPPGAVPLTGFESVEPGDPRVSGPHVEQIVRPGGDPVLAYGGRLTRFETTLPPGRWRLTLWTEDPGAWETLPVLLQQRIRVNGDDLLYLNRDYGGWVAQRYLAGRSREADPAETPFAAIGARRGGRVSGIVTVTENGVLAVELAGFPQTATHIAAITAEPANLPPVAESAVEAIRAARFAESWPVLMPPPAPRPVESLSLTTSMPATSMPAGSMPAGPTPAVTAPGGIAILRMSALTPEVTTATPTILWDGPSLPARLLWGQWRWRRPSANAAGLVFSAAHLRGDAEKIPLRPDLPRLLVMVLHIPSGDDANAGVHRGRLRLHTPNGDVEAPFAVEVLPIVRPAPSARVGAFLGFAPQLLGTPEWSKDAARRNARAQAACDLNTLSDLGLTAITAPLSAPDTDPDDFVNDLRSTLARFPAPVIAYEPLRAYAFRHQPAETAAMLAKANAVVKEAGLPSVIWSIADEPSYAGTTADIRALAKAIQAVDPTAQLAGHLNDPRDTVLLPDLAMVTVNAGFGVDAADIARLRERRLRPWLYNMDQPRLASGAYLWRSGADGMLQWHARMPTADPFDPTDGREGDVQFLWPTPGVCAPADLDDDVLALAEGEEDLRWLAWLDQQAIDNNAAGQLLRRLRREIPADWAAAMSLPAEQPTVWRNLIADLARKLKN